MALTSAEKLSRAVEKLSQLEKEAAQVADLIAMIDAGEPPLLSFSRRPGDVYALGPNQTRNALAADQVTITGKIATLQAKVDQAADITG